MTFDILCLKAFSLFFFFPPSQASWTTVWRRLHTFCANRRFLLMWSVCQTSLHSTFRQSASTSAHLVSTSPLPCWRMLGTPWNLSERSVFLFTKAVEESWNQFSRVTEFWPHKLYCVRLMHTPSAISAVTLWKKIDHSIDHQLRPLPLPQGGVLNFFLS